MMARDLPTNEYGMEFINIEIEHSLLGLLIWNNSAAIEAGIRADDFCYPAHQLIFVEMLRLMAEKASFSVLDFSRFQVADLPADTGAMHYLQQCSDLIPSRGLEQALAYRDFLRELAKKRRIKAMLDEARMVMREKKADEIFSWIRTRTEAEQQVQEIRSGQAVHDAFARSLTQPRACYPTGLAMLDNAMKGGLYAGWTYGFAGNEKAGKTTLAHTISYNLSETGCKHLYVAMEMGSEQIEARNVARRLGVNSLRFLEGDMILAQQAAASKATENVFYLDAPGERLEEIIQHIGAASIVHGIKGFIIDYWQLVGGQERGESEEKHLRRVAQGFADYAKKKGLWCILLAQLNKEGSLFGGNGLKKACDQLYFLKEPQDRPSSRWLEMDASRYTPKAPVGSEEWPSLHLQKGAGPYFKSS